MADMKDITKPLLSLIRERQKTPNLLSVKEASKKLKTSMKNVIQTAEDEGININVGFQIGNGYAELPKREWTMEDLNSPYQ